MTTPACRRCGADIQIRFVGAIRVWMHVKPAISHAAMPPKVTK